MRAMIASLTIAELNFATIREARLADVLDALADGIIVVDEAGHILMINKACERLFGYGAGEMTGESVNRLMPFQSFNGHKNQAPAPGAIDHYGALSIGREVKGQHKDGRVFALEFSVCEICTLEGSQFIGILRDRHPKAADNDVAVHDFSGSGPLTPRERDVLHQIAAGASNKEAGRKLGISPRTIEVHRARIMEKLGAKNAADLVRIVLTGNARAERSRQEPIRRQSARAQS